MLLFLLAAALSEAPSTNDVADLREVKARYGDCVVRRHVLAARKFVLKPDAQWYNSEELGDGDCLIAATEAADGVEMTFPGDTMRYSLADALVRREFSTGPAPSIGNASPLVQAQLDEADYTPKPGKKYDEAELKDLADSRDKKMAVLFLANFGECIVRAAPVESYALLMTEHTTAAESAAFAALKPALAQCFPADQSLTFTRVTLRGTVAVNYYRLAHAPRAAGSNAGATK